MKLNAEGKKLYDIWDKNYCKENDKLGGNSAEGNFVEGWSIIDNNDYVKTLTDACGILIFGYGNCAVNMIDEWINSDSITVKAYGFTYGEIKKELLKYFVEV